MMPKKPLPQSDSDDRIAEDLDRVLAELEAGDALYGNAIDGLSASIDTRAQELENYDLDGRMAQAEDDVAGMAIATLEEDVVEEESFAREMDEDEAEEERLLEEDEHAPNE